jgi:hypothetical protein
LQRLHLCGGQFAPFAGLEVFNGQAADGDSRQPQHRMPKRRCHAANLALFAFGHDDAQDSFAVAALRDFDDAGRGYAVFQFDATLPTADRFGGWQASDDNTVRLGVAKLGVCELLRHLAVVRQHDQPFAVSIEAANRKQASTPNRHKIVDRLALIIAEGVVRAQDLLGLKQRDV